MERHYLTPSLRQAISRLERVGTSMTAFPRGRRRGQRIPVGKGEARKALTAVTTATDIHTINAKGDLCVGDDVAIPGAKQPRGLAGTLFAIKAAGACAADGGDLDAVHAAAQAPRPDYLCRYLEFR